MFRHRCVRVPRVVVTVGGYARERRQRRKPVAYRQGEGGRGHVMESSISPPLAPALHGTRTGADWEKVWQTGGENGEPLRVGDKFDAGRSSPMLHAHLDAVKQHVQGKDVLIPGCGRAYDVLSFARAGASSALGLDVAPTALAEARNLLKAAFVEEPELERACRVDSTDFFELSGSSVTATTIPATFDIVYDYTFFCAIEPSLRSAWAQTMSRLVKPGGELWTMIFPLSNHEGGPPFAVSIEAYESALGACFEKRSIEKVDDNLSHPGRAGKEAFGVWVRRQ